MRIYSAIVLNWTVQGSSPGRVWCSFAAHGGLQRPWKLLPLRDPLTRPGPRWGRGAGYHPAPGGAETFGAPRLACIQRG